MVRHRADPGRPRNSVGLFAFSDVQRDLGTLTLLPHFAGQEQIPGLVNRETNQPGDLVAYASCRYAAFDHHADLSLGPQTVTFRHGDFQGTAKIYLADTNGSSVPVMAEINGGSATTAVTVPRGTRIVSFGMILPLYGSLTPAGLGDEELQEVLGEWTVEGSPQFGDKFLGTNTLIAAGDPGAGSTPFTFNLRALVVENVGRTSLPDIVEPVTGKPLSGGARFTAEARMAGGGTQRYEGFHDSLVYKAQVFANEGGVVRTIYGVGAIPDEAGTGITIDWDGKDDAGVSVPGETEYGVSITAMLYRGTEPPGASTIGYIFNVTPAVGPAGLAPEALGAIEVSPDPYIPYTPEELQHTFDEDGNPAWFDDNGDGEIDRFPDHDNDGEPDFEPGGEPPGIFIKARLSKPGYTMSAWRLEIFSEDGAPLHEDAGDSRFGVDGEYEWKSSLIPPDLEPQELKIKIVPTYCRKLKPDLQVLGRTTECGAGDPVEGSAQYGEKEGLLEIFDATTDELIATSEPKPYVEGSDQLLASLGLVGLGPTIILATSNDHVLLKPRNTNKSLRVRYVVDKKKAGDKTSIDLRVRSTVSNLTGFSVSLPRKSATSSNVEFSETFTLTGSGSSGGRSIRVNEVSGPTFSTYDYNSGAVPSGADPETDYSSGNAQDGMEFEAGEEGTRLGRAAKLTPSESNSKGYRAKKIPPTRTSLVAAGFEDLLFEREGTGVRAWTRVQNQCRKLYISGEGGKDGSFYGVDKYIGPNEVGDHWKDSLQLVIAAGCSVFNIGNFNDWASYDVYGSPGVEWRARVKDDCFLLGYGATAPKADLGLGGLYIDTRVLIRYREYLPGQQSRYSDPGEAQAMAWLLANAAMEHRQADDACAITKDYYYFIHFVCTDLKGKRIEDPHFIAEAGTVSGSTERQIFRVHRSLWGKKGWAALNASVPEGSSSLKMMRDLPDAGPGQSERI